MRILIYLTLFLATAASALGQTTNTYTQMKDAELHAVFHETMVLSEYRTFKGINDKSYDFTEYHYADGSTDYIEKGSKSEKGRWNIVGSDKICYRYPTTDAFSQTYCFFIYRQGKCYYQYGLTEMTVHGPRSWDLWVSRFVRKGEGGVCGDALS